MNQLNDVTLSKLINSSDTAAKKKLIYNTSTSSRILYKFLDDDRIDVIQAVLTHPNIDEKIFNKIIDPNFRSFPDYVYKMILQNPGFKKEWIHRYIDFLKNLNNSFDIIYPILKNKKFFKNDKEWIILYKIIKNIKSNIKKEQCVIFWYEFLLYPAHKTSEKIILLILSDYGKEIVDIGSTFELNLFMNTPKINAKMFELTNKIEFLSQEAQDIFVF